MSTCTIGFRVDRGRRQPQSWPYMRVNISGRGAPDGEGALPVRRSLWSDVCSLVGLAKSDPRAPRSVPEANRTFSSLIKEGCGLRERRIARTRSLPAQLPRHGPTAHFGSVVSSAAGTGV